MASLPIKIKLFHNFMKLNQMGFGYLHFSVAAKQISPADRHWTTVSDSVKHLIKRKAVLRSIG
ncbi:hypothetical protein D3OALGA1CA_209 [Olavius algarvensis associated proteobacterium Delta 3]|nr:hypothetical protein D3OALGA1CA_209 [Olavius algarvensis associated proteobacterium Delta 3]CAB5156635.1 hypothetical protein D3OALGB2SA_5148 [Olavius algarvensis associated proteobacterium Delta 3]